MGQPLNGDRPGNLTRTQLTDRLNRATEELDLLLARHQAQAELMGVRLLDLRTPAGDLVIGPVLVAQAQVLAALAGLER